MSTVQPNNAVCDMITARDYAPLNACERAIVQAGIMTATPRESIARNGLCLYHPEIVRALSLSNSQVLRLLQKDTQISPRTSPFSSFEIIG